MVNPVNHTIDPFDEKLVERIAAAKTPAERLSWQLERRLRLGWGEFIRREVLSASQPPIISDVLEAITAAFARLAAEAIESAIEHTQDPETAKGDALAFVTDNFTGTLKAHIDAGRYESMGVLHRLNA